jgi:hypothetical protein
MNFLTPRSIGLEIQFHGSERRVYIPRIQRGNAYFAAKVLGARGPLLSVLVHFFEQGRWGPLVETGLGGHSLTVEDQVFILTQAGLYLTDMQGYSSPEARTCYERVESLCSSLNRPLLLYTALIGKFRYSLVTQKVSATMQIAKELFSLAQGQNDSALMTEACAASAGSLYFLGDFESARQYTRGVCKYGVRKAYSLISMRVGTSVVYSSGPY